jgi:hypothetical protein
MEIYSKDDENDGDFSGTAIAERGVPAGDKCGIAVGLCSAFKGMTKL